MLAAANKEGSSLEPCFLNPGPVEAYLRSTAMAAAASREGSSLAAAGLSVAASSSWRELPTSLACATQRRRQAAICNHIRGFRRIYRVWQICRQTQKVDHMIAEVINVLGRAYRAWESQYAGVSETKLLILASFVHSGWPK